MFVSYRKRFQTENWMLANRLIRRRLLCPVENARGEKQRSWRQSN